MRAVHKDPVTANVVKRLLQKTRFDIATGCLNWVGSKDKDKAGRFWRNRKIERAHATAHTLFCGPVEPGEIIRHTCGNPSCVNPMHLQKAPAVGFTASKSAPPVGPSLRRAIEALSALKAEKAWLTPGRIAGVLGMPVKAVTAVLNASEPRPL